MPRGPGGYEHTNRAMVRSEILLRDALDVFDRDRANRGEILAQRAPAFDQLEPGKQHRLIEVGVLSEHELRLDLVLRLGEVMLGNAVGGDRFEFALERGLDISHLLVGKHLAGKGEEVRVEGEQGVVRVDVAG